LPNTTKKAARKAAIEVEMERRHRDAERTAPIERIQPLDAHRDPTCLGRRMPRSGRASVT
jgi:hypothetical protein